MTVLSAVVPSQVPTSPVMVAAVLYEFAGVFSVDVTYVSCQGGLATELMESIRRKERDHGWRLVDFTHCSLPFGRYPKELVMWMQVAMTILSTREITVREEVINVFVSSQDPITKRVKDLLKDWADQTKGVLGRRPHSIKLTFLP
jgi:hypothetical protein